jgi:lactate dehydrogenase-like 2-hydroxyacid dehydrogenase
MEKWKTLSQDKATTKKSGTMIATIPMKTQTWRTMTAATMMANKKSKARKTST